MTKTIVITESDALFVGVGSSTDSCQAVPGTVGGLGIDPCPDMPIRAGIWRYEANRASRSTPRRTVSRRSFGIWSRSH